MTNLRTFEDAETVLAAALPGYQSRPPQQRLARAINDAIESRTHLIAEAGTGTGKSLAYLIESILSNQRVVVSTATKALQDQLATKDIPFLAEHLGVPFTYAVLKGRSNYLCPERALSSEGVTALRAILEYAEGAGEGFTGERDEFPFPISDHDWREVAADSDTCSDLKCRDFDQCYATKARNRAENSMVVVVNHALFFTDLKVRELTDGYANMLGDYDLVVFDEAHEVESYASNAMADQLTEGTFAAIFSRLRSFAQSQGLVDDIDPELMRANTAVADLWSKLEVGRIRPGTMADHEEAWGEVFDSLEAVVEAWMPNWNRLKHSLVKPDSTRGKMATRSLVKLVQRFGSYITDDWTRTVRYVEEQWRQRSGRRVAIKTLRSVPINVGPFLRDNLFDPVREDGPSPIAVLVSATVAVKGGMGYIAGRLGIDSYDELDVGTPFDFSTQARLYVPTDLPEPNMANRAAWSNLMRETVYELVRASDGRALLLFTSYREMSATYDAIAHRLPYECLRQGQAPNRELVARFTEDTESVLFATRSFFTGVDFQGETCSLVVIDKLPFPVPSDPLVEARQEEVERNGGNSFSDYAIPEMTLPLKQGVGRLIRHSNDHGVMAILDPRLVTKGYGKAILRSLPNAPLVERLDEVESFFASAPGLVAS